MSQESGFDIIILHGNMGSPEGNWFPSVKSELTKKGHNVFVPTSPTPEKQSKESCCKTLREQAPVFGKNTVLIGHSIGATLMMHILEMVREPIHQSIFVSPVMDKIGNNEYDDLNRTFTDKMPDFDWLTMSNNMGTCHIFYSDNDTYALLYLFIAAVGTYLSYELLNYNIYLGISVFVLMLLLLSIINLLYQNLEATKVVKKQIDADNDLILTRIHQLHLVTEKRNNAQKN